MPFQWHYDIENKGDTTHSKVGIAIPCALLGRYVRARTGVLRYIIKTLLAIRSTSYLDIYDFCMDEEKREGFLKRLDPGDPSHAPLVKWWRKYPTLGFPKDTMLPIIIRMTTAVTIPPISKMLGPAKNRLNIEDIIRNRKILLVDLSTAGEEVGQFMGILLVSRIQQAV